MSREKKKAKPMQSVQPQAEPIYAVGAHVRVKHGIRDPNYPDMPLGGWAGTVVERDTISPSPTYLVEWDADTLKHMHPVFRNRCERDGLDETNSWLGEEDLELDAGDPPHMEQPTDIRARALNPTIQEDRIRAIMQLTSDDAWPAINDANLRRYYDYLAANLTLPLAVEYVDPGLGFPLASRSAQSPPLQIVELLPPKAGVRSGGLICAVQLGDQRQELPLSDLESVRKGQPWQLLADYAFWFCESDHESEPEGRAKETGDQSPQVASTEGWRFVGNTISSCGLVGAGVGATVGAIAATMDHVPYSMAVGALTLALVGYIAGTRFGFFMGKSQGIKYGPILGGMLGLIAGAVLGTVAGPLVIAHVGTIFGSIVGTLFGYVFHKINRRLPGPLYVGLAGALLGALIQAFVEDVNQTLSGLLYGTPAGAVAGLVLGVGFFAAIAIFNLNRQKPE
jgi:hypothetical protein